MQVMTPEPSVVSVQMQSVSREQSDCVGRLEQAVLHLAVVADHMHEDADVHAAGVAIELQAAVHAPD